MTATKHTKVIILHHLTYKFIRLFVVEGEQKYQVNKYSNGILSCFKVEHI